MSSKRKFKLLLILFLFVIFPRKVNAQILINEFNPRNPEWVELINTSTSEINLSGYYFDDDSDFSSDSGNSTKVLIQGLFQPSSLCYIDLNSYLNDGGDTPTLFASNGDIQDTYTYASSSSGLSYSRVPDAGGWQIDTNHSKTIYACSSLSTPTPTPTQSPTNPPTSEPTKTATPISTTTATTKPSSTKTPSPKPIATPTELPEETNEPENQIKDIKIENIETTPIGMVAGANTTKKSPIVAIIFTSLGVIVLGYCGYLLYNEKYGKKKEIS